MLILCFASQHKWTSWKSNHLRPIYLSCMQRERERGVVAYSWKQTTPMSWLTYDMQRYRKVSGPTLVGYLFQTPLFEWWGCKNRHQKVVCLKDWTMFLNFGNNSWFNSQHNWEGVYPIILEFFTLMIHEMFIWAPWIMRKLSTCLICIH